MMISIDYKSSQYRGKTSVQRILERYHEAMRPEIKDFMKMCERMMSLAVQSGELSEEECQMVDYYVTELQSIVHPICLRKAQTISLPSSGS